MKDSLHGLVALVTGATEGIGRATAEQLVQRGARVLIVGRSKEKVRSVSREVCVLGKNAVDGFVADLTSPEDIQRLGHDLKKRYSKLHVLINNAGGIFASRSETSEGIERTFALNHLGYYRVTSAVFDLLIAAAPARIVNVTSRLHKMGKLQFDDLQLRKTYSGLAAYKRSKLANVLFTYELARRAWALGITVNCIHPGVVGSGFGHNNGGLIGWYVRAFRPLMLTPAASARAIVRVATDPALVNISGCYFERETMKKSSPASYDLSLAQRLWQETEMISHCKIDIPECTDVSAFSKPTA